MSSRLKEQYLNEIVPAMEKKFGYTNTMQVPKLNKIVGPGWEIPGYTLKGWASNKANADAGKVWKPDGAWLKDGTAEGKTLSIYAIWQ